MRESNRVYCFGANSQGELGRGNTSPSAAVAPTTAVLTDAIAVYGSITYSGGGLSPDDAERLALGRCNADRRARGTCQLRTTVCGDGRLDSSTARAP